MAQQDDKQIFSDEELQKLKEAIEAGLSNLQAIYSTGVPEEKFDIWYARCGGVDLITKWRVMRTVPAKLLAYKPTNHREAIEILERDKDTREEFLKQSKIDVTSGGEKLQPLLVKFIDGNTNPDRVQEAV